MRYICSICGYVYDEEKEGVPFSSLPDTWVCPLCRAAKSLFAPERQPETASAPVTPALARETHVPDEAPELLSPLVLSALCSNLARGCEKQYKEEEAALFQEIADYFAAAAPASQDDSGSLAGLLQDDLDRGYPAVHGAARELGDRGTQRVCVWGEKVTMILNSLAQRYRAEGPSFLKYTQIWVCSVCGFVFVGNEPPELCPVCKVPAWKFDKIEGRASK